MYAQMLLRGDEDYGFINFVDLPSGSYTYKTISHAAAAKWTTMREYNAIADNHCAATAVTNLALYFAAKGYTDLLVNQNKRDTFRAVHAIVGDGPVATIADKSAEFFKNCGYKLKYTKADTASSFQKAIDQDRICGILLSGGLLEWHWILAYGYRKYADALYMRIINNWDVDPNLYYKPHSGSVQISCTQYFIEA